MRSQYSWSMQMAIFLSDLEKEESNYPEIIDDLKLGWCYAITEK
uniref:Uncharacterized protein n=1 Tax=Lepeophtheirus salmonis TaxID=72036 RepID=A0A0K2VJB6_LEPSM